MENFNGKLQWKTILILFFILLFPYKLFSQVVIGSSEEPEKGALLQLKNIEGISGGNANSTKGFLLPRVKLTVLSSLKDISGTSGKNLEEYVGLTVYNSEASNNSCLVAPEGIYVWDGKKWNNILGEPTDEIGGSFIGDLKALEKVKEDNPGNTLDWQIDYTTDPNNPQVTGNGLYWKEVCGEQRLYKIDGFRSKRISKLDLSDATAIEYLDASGSDVQHLAMHNKRVTTLNASNMDELTSLDLTGADALINLYVNDTPITEINVLANKNISLINAYRTKIENLNITNMPQLRHVSIYNTPTLQKIDATGTKSLIYLHFYGSIAESGISTVKVCNSVLSNYSADLNPGILSSSYFQIPCD